MENMRERKLNNDDKGEIAARENTIFNAEEFFEAHGKAIEDYAQERGIVFRRGKKWAISMERGEATFDPKFFAEKGYSAAESMWATCHEIEHFRDWRKDPEAYSRLFARMKHSRRIHLLYDCLDDIMVNREVDRRFLVHQQTKDFLYKNKLFPDVNYSSRPKHLQFVYTMLREKMLPGEILTLDPEVRKKVEKLKDIDGQGTDLINLVSDPDAKPADRFEIIRDYIEPIYEKFFQEDVEKRKQQEGKGKADKGAAKSGEDYFEDEYDDFADKSPDIIPVGDIKDELDKWIKKRKEDEEKTPEEIAKKQFETEHGISAQEIESYRVDYKKIEQYIEPLREIFERIISTRKEIKRRLKKRTDQGVVLDPSLISQAYIDAQSGILDSRTQLKIKKEEFDENKPNDFELTLVCDLSGSMDENHPGGKSYEQRLCTILITEALAEFEEKLKRERLEKALDLRVLTEARGFGDKDEELKPMSGAIDYEIRIKIAKRLANCDGGHTRDFESLTKIDRGITEQTRRKIENNDLKKIVLLITDGGSDDVRQAKKEKDALTKAGVIAKAIQIGKVDAGDREKFKIVWQKDGLRCQNVVQLVPVIEKLLEQFLSDL